MLQIISGKFFKDGEIVHNECNGILYSNVAFHSMHPIEYENIKINTVDWHPGYPCYVISYDNCIEHTPKTSILVKIGDNVVIEQLKYILSFSLNAIFDESESVIEDLCRRGNAHDNYILRFVTRIQDGLKKDVEKKKDSSLQLADVFACDAFSGLDDIIIDWALEQLNDEILDAQIDGLNIAQVADQRMSKAYHYSERYKNEYTTIKYAYLMMKSVSLMEQFQRKDLLHLMINQKK